MYYSEQLSWLFYRNISTEHRYFGLAMFCYRNLPNVFKAQQVKVVYSCKLPVRDHYLYPSYKKAYMCWLYKKHLRHYIVSNTVSVEDRERKTSTVLSKPNPTRATSQSASTNNRACITWTSHPFTCWWKNINTVVIGLCVVFSRKSIMNNEMLFSFRKHRLPRFVLLHVSQ